MLLLSLLLLGSASAFNPHQLDPSIPTIAPDQHQNRDSCAGHCAFQFVDDISTQLGATRAASLLQLNYNDFLTAFSNTTFFETFCNVYHKFQHCSSKCEPGYLHQMLMRSSEIIDHYCVYHFEDIRKSFPCLGQVDPPHDCVKQCTQHHNAVTSLMNNFNHLASNGDTSRAEKYLAESCEYVTCSLHCATPPIAHHCGFPTAQLVIDLTRKSFNSMETLALDTGAVKKWPKMCSDIKTYRLPTPGAQPPTQGDVIEQSDSPVITTTDRAVETNRVQFTAERSSRSSANLSPSLSISQQIISSAILLLTLL